MILATSPTELWRGAAIAACFVLLGMLTVFVRLRVAEWHGARNRVSLGRALSATAYWLLALALLFSHVVAVGNDESLGPRLVIATPGYVLGIVGMTIILRGER